MVDVGTLHTESTIKCSITYVYKYTIQFEMLMLKHFYSLIKYFVRENGQICEESKINSFIKKTINNQHLVKVSFYKYSKTS